VRLAFVSWGEDRIRAARTMLGLSPATALGHWLIATVLIARGAFDAALDVLRDGCTAQDEESAGRGTFPAVGLYLLRGLVLAAQQRLDEAVDALTRELSGIDKGQMYARECVANTWYALGAIHLRRRQRDAAEDAFANALRVAPAHVFTLAALGRLPSVPSFTIHPSTPLGAGDSRFTIDLDRQLAGAIALARAGRHGEAAQTYRMAIEGLPSTMQSAGWLLPVEPLLDPMSRRDIWGDVLAIVRRRAL
jgi:tetratricopeptide (TPR) repeat protein